MARFISQSPKLSQEASCSFCFFSTSCLISKPRFAPGSSCFSWLPLEPPEPITLESRFSAAPLPSNNNSDWIRDQQHSQEPCKAFAGCPEDPTPAHRPPAANPHNLLLSPSSAGAVAVIHITPPGIPISLFPLPTLPEHDPSLLWISVFTKLKLKINFNYRNQIAISINHWGPLGDTDRRLHLEVEGGRDNDSFSHRVPPCIHWTILINVIIFCIVDGIKGRRMELESVLNK